MVAVSESSGAGSPSAQEIKPSAPAVFDGIEPCLCRESGLKGDICYTGIVAISIGNPGPIVVENDIFLKYTPFDEAGFALRKSAINAEMFANKSSALKSALPTEQWIIPFLSVR